MRHQRLALVVAISCFSSYGISADVQLSPADSAGAFKAAGFKQKGRKWISCAEGQVTEVRDINGDGLPEAIVTESSTDCFGMTGEGYSLVSKQGNGTWKLLSNGAGIAMFLDTKGVGGWPDLQVGGPGFCFPVYRWNGQKYALQRYEYEGKRCKPS